jgi:GNAT superfamily N-acetyltransferase
LGGEVQMQYSIRLATPGDIPTIESLIARSIRALGAGDYTAQQIDAALTGAFGVDTQLIADRTYFVVVNNDIVLGCGGWSKRRTLFGNDAHTQRDAQELDPQCDAAKIRAFFVDPDYARHGIGAALLTHCESAARSFGFSAFELMATLPGMRLYQARGYLAGTAIRHSLGGDLTIEFVPMRKSDSGD